MGGRRGKGGGRVKGGWVEGVKGWFLGMREGWRDVPLWLMQVETRWSNGVPGRKAGRNGVAGNLNVGQLPRMGHSTTDFRGVGFTAKDWKVEVWLHLLAREVDQMPNPPAWLSAARDFWRIQVTPSINGCIDVGLDELLTDEERVATMRDVAQHVFSWLVRLGERVPRDFLNDLYRSPPPGEWPQDVETELFLQFGRALLKLLDGKMTTHELA